MGEAGDNRELVALVEERADTSIRRVWHDGQWYFSIVDVIAVLTDSPNPRNYWNMLKRKLSAEGASQLYTEPVQLRLRSPRDGKHYRTDAFDKEALYRIVQTVPSTRAEPLKVWLARAGVEKDEGMSAVVPALPTLPEPRPDASEAMRAVYAEMTTRLREVLAEYETRLAALEGWRDYLEGWRIYIGAWHEAAESRFEVQDAQLDLLPDLIAH